MREKEITHACYLCVFVFFIFKKFLHWLSLKRKEIVVDSSRKRYRFPEWDQVPERDMFPAKGLRF